MRSLVFALVMIAGGLVMLGGQGRAVRGGDLRTDTTLKVGDPAPDFDLPHLRGDGQVRLSTFKGVRPVALIFGSYT